MPNGFPWIQFLISVFAGIALVTSIWSLKYSYDANRIGKNANKTSQKALTLARQVFIEEQRPRLQLKPVIGNGIALQCRQEENKLIFTVNINMKNTGKTPANNITCLKDSMKLIMPSHEYDAKDSNAPSVATSLSPNQDFNLSRVLSTSHPDPDMIKDAIVAWREERVYVLADISLKYTDVSSEHEYSVSGSYKITSKTDFIVDYKDE